MFYRYILFLMACAGPACSQGQAHYLLADFGGNIEHSSVATGKNEFFFIADHPSFYQKTLRRSDGTPQNTVLLSDTLALRFTRHLAVAGEYVIFEGGIGGERFLYSIHRETGMLVPLLSHDAPFISELLPFDDNRAIAFLKSINGQSEQKIYITDGTPSGTLLLGQFELVNTSFRMVPYGDQWLIISKESPLNRFPVIITDGTPAGTLLLEQYIFNHTGHLPDYIISAAPVDNDLFISLRDGTERHLRDGQLTSYDIPGPVDYVFHLEDRYLHFAYSVYVSGADFTAYEEFTSPNLPSGFLPGSQPVWCNGYIYYYSNPGFRPYKRNTGRISSDHARPFAF